MNIPATFVQTTIRHEFKFWTLAFCSACFLFGAFGVADHIESIVAPVLRHVRIGMAYNMSDGRLCWSFDGEKTRPAVATQYFAKVFEDDNPRPVYRELSHGDGSPYGTISASIGDKSYGFPIGAFSQIMCTRIDHVNAGFKRLGVRLDFEYDVPDRPYTISQPSMWIDYYSPNRKM